MLCTAGEPGTPPNGDLYLFEIPEIGCLVAADERFHLEFDVDRYGDDPVAMLEVVS